MISWDKKINLNIRIKFRLSEEGKKNLYLKQAMEPYRETDYTDSWYEMQLWNLIEIYGKEINMGSPTCIQNNLITLEQNQDGNEGE